ncbi:MAG: hypothetical protein LBQ39_03180 [Tannerellaceae bacterium]|jgi:hypothetical protein|nr:hypothetical protein [Tannerellaceae bacterium]
MKRMMSIGLLFLLLAIAVRPTLAFHFCGGSLFSVGISSSYTPSACCDGEMGCCSNYTVTLSTDTYHLPATLSLEATGDQAVFLPVTGWLRPLGGGYPPSGLLLQTLFPPGSLAGRTADRLALMCILRI